MIPSLLSEPASKPPPETQRLKRRLAILALLLLTGLTALPAAAQSAPPRIPRFYYRLKRHRAFQHEMITRLRLELPRRPVHEFAPGGLTLDYTPPTSADVIEGYRSWRRTHDAMGRSYDAPFSHTLYGDRVESIRAREARIAQESNEGVISDIKIEWLATTLKISGRKLFELAYTTKDYENPPDPTLEGGQRDFSMDQETQIRVEGTIAERVIVNVDYDDTRENDARNEISLIYEGEDDEFIKRGELGDVMLSVPSTRFVSYSAKSLFGVKVEGGLGEWMNFTLIGSREKGVTEEEQYTGAGQLQRESIRDTDYTERLHYRADSNENHFGDPNTPIQIAEDPVDGGAVFDIWIYASGQTHDPTIDYYDFEADRYDDEADDSPTAPPVPTGETYSSSYWRLLEPVNDYTINKHTGRLDFKSTVQSYEYVAISYAVALQSSPTQIVYQVGGGALPLPKLLKSGQTGDDSLLDYMHENIYYLGATGVELDSDFLLQIEDLQGRTNDAEDINDNGDTEEPLVRALGLTRDPGGADDSISPQVIDQDKGLLVFPERYPFRKDGEEDTDEDAYDPSYGNRNHRYNIRVEFHSASAARFLRPNIIPGSEEIRLNGRKLVRDVDYIIDYDSGYLEFLIPGANDSDADLDITYEYQPLFGDSGKTLAGGRLEFKPFEFFTIGGTYIGEWTDKPMDASEVPELRAIPSMHQVIDTDAKLELKNDFMTSLVSWLPGVDSEAQSTLLVEGEMAYSFYNPNRVGRTHLDDLEGAHQSISMPLLDTDWLPSSPPTYAGELYDQADRRLVDLDDVNNYPQSQIDPDWRTDETATLLEVSDLPQQADQWDSFARIIAANGLDLGERNLEYLEFYLYRGGTFNGGVLHFDIGMINEDADGDFVDDGSYTGYDSEDQGSEPGFEPFGSDPGELDGRLQTGEDTGIEFNNGYLETTIGADDGFLTTEDLDFNLTLDTTESYYGYAVPLDEIPPEYLGRELGNGWVTVRIPLELDTVRPGDNNPPTNAVIKTMRIWIESTVEGSFAPSSFLYLYRVQLKGVRWKETFLDPDSAFNQLDVGTIDSETDADYIPLEPTTDDDGFVEREQALELKYTAPAWNDYGFDGLPGSGSFGPGSGEYSLSPGSRPDPGENDGILNTEDTNHNGILDAGEDIGWAGYDPALTGAGNGVLDSEDEIVLLAEQEFLDSRDLTTHGTLSVSFYNRNHERAQVDLATFRIGTDEDNYYEFRAPLGEIDGGWQRVDVPFDELVALRQHYEELDPDTRPLVYREGNLAVKGSPSLVRVYWMAAGVTTTAPMDGYAGPDSEPGRVWVNNIDLYDAVQREGRAVRGRVMLDFGDALVLQGDYTKLDGDFQSIGLRRTGITSEDYQASGTLQLGAFLPNEWKIGLPLSASYTRSDDYVANIAEYEGSLEDVGRTTSDTTKVSLGFNRVNLPRINLSYTDYNGFNESFGRRDDDVTYSADLDYSLLQGFFLLPTKINARYLYQSQRTDYDDDTGRVDTHTGEHEFNSSLTWQFIRGLSLTPRYSFTDSRDLRRGEDIGFGQTSGVSLSYNRYRLVQPSLDYLTTYTERFNPGGSTTADTYDVSVSNNFTASLPTSPGLLIEDYFGSWTANANFSLRRGSTYNDTGGTPPPEYVWGWDTVWKEAGEAVSASRGYSYMISTRLRPLEFFRASSNTSLHELDFLLAQLKYSFSNDLTESYGTTSQTWTETWPAGDLTITTTRYFPIFAELLQQSILKLGFQKTTVKQIGVSTSRTYSPNFSWRATWSDALSTTADYTETTTITDEEDSLFGFGGAHRVTNTYNPAMSLTYNIELPGTFTIPFLGGDVPLRNDLRLTGRYSYKLVQGNEDSGADETKRHTASLSAAYYLTTNIHADLALTYEDFTNETSVGYNYNSFDVRLTMEIKF